MFGYLSVIIVKYKLRLTSFIYKPHYCDNTIVTVMACRDKYDPKSYRLDYEFMVKGKYFQRKDMEVRFKI